MPTTSRPATVVHGAFVTLSAATFLASVLTGAVARGLILAAVSAITAVWILRTISRRGLTSRTIWWSLFLGFLFVTVDIVISVVAVDIRGAAAPPQPWANALIGLGYLGLLAAALLLIMPAARRDTGGVLDAATLSVGAAAALWVVVLSPTFQQTGASLATRTTTLCVVVMLAAIAGTLMRAAATTPAARPTLAYFVGAVLLTLVVTVLLAMTADPLTGAVPSQITSLWPVTYIAAWAAVAHPASGTMTRSHSRGEDHLTRGRVARLGLVLCIGPLLGALQQGTGHPVDWLMLSVSQVVLVALALARITQIATAHAESARLLEHLAHHDPLTGLANRRAVDRHLQSLVGRVNSGAAPGVVILFIDLNGFKVVNDTLGHRLGDDLLAAVADRLAGCVRRETGDLAGRLGGDEFILILERRPAELRSAAAGRVEHALADPFELGGHLVPMTASIGLADSESSADVTVDDLLSRADHAMYDSKRSSTDAVGV